MNWVDAGLVMMLLGSVIVGSKKGLIRESMAFIVFFVAVIVAVSYIDNLAVWVHVRLGGTPIVSAFLSFFILIALTYVTFKVLGMVFYKIANLKDTGKRDQMGGAVVGFLRGWVSVGFVTMLLFLLPLPSVFYTAFEESFFGPTIARTIPLIYDATAVAHPKKPEFLPQIEKALLLESADDYGDTSTLPEDRAEVFRVLYRMEKYFGKGVDGGA